MLNFNEDDLKPAIIAAAVDQLLANDADLSRLVSKEVASRLDKIFVDRAQNQIEAAIDDAIKDGFDREYQRVTQWGDPEGAKTTIRAQLEKIVGGYWNSVVNAKTGKPSTSSCDGVTRAEYLMTQICAQDFSDGMKSSVINVTGALKDGLRNQLGKQMDAMLADLFHIKSLQDQGLVKKPY